MELTDQHQTPEYPWIVFGLRASSHLPFLQEVYIQMIDFYYHKNLNCGNSVTHHQNCDGYYDCDDYFNLNANSDRHVMNDEKNVNDDPQLIWHLRSSKSYIHS